MAKIKKFNIKNFRGIEEAEICLCNRSDTPILTLVGLNESGKTTILEAISHFVTGDPIVAKVFGGASAASQTLSLIPIQKKANFTGVVSISAVVALDEQDIDCFVKIAASQYKLTLDASALKKDVVVSKNYAFKDGNYDPDASRPTFGAEVFVKKKNQSEFKKYEHKGAGSSLFQDLWDAMRARLPNVSYFPTFLVDFPARIYLREHVGETPTNRHYRSVLQGVLDSLDDGLDLETHVAKRIEDYKGQEGSSNWLASFWAAPAKSQVISVIHKLSNAISREIIGSWNKVFRTPTSARAISLDFNIDTEKHNMPYVTFYVSDGESQYSLHERSLGFRWFFSFLLFTRFKQNNGSNTIFLFDEPAANLHARAQGELLKSFSRITEGGNAIIYSTHSHYMIDPCWLSGVYIIENKAIDYDSEEVGLLTTLPTKINAVSFKTFVSSFPDRVSYFQPILERLEYQEAMLTPTKPIVITEGISDFHAFKYLGSSLMARAPFEFVPGLGAGSSSPLISLCLGTGRPFVILLDDDKQGRRDAEQYRQKWFLKGEVVTLRDLVAEADGMALEAFLGEEMREIIAQSFGREGNSVSKKEVGIYFAEAHYKKPAVPASRNALDKVRLLIGRLSERFAALEKVMEPEALKTPPLPFRP